MNTKTMFAMVAIMAAIGTVGITTAIMSSITPAHAQQGKGGECHITGKPGVGTRGCTGPSPINSMQSGVAPPDTMCTQKGCHSTGPNK